MRPRRLAAVVIAALVVAAPASAHEALSSSQPDTEPARDAAPAQTTRQAPQPRTAPRAPGTQVRQRTQTHRTQRAQSERVLRASGAEASSPTVAGVEPSQAAQPGRTLRYGTPHEAGLAPGHLAAVPAALRSFLRPSPESPDHPMYPGGVVLAARHGVIATHVAAGKAVRYTGAGTELPEAEQIPARRGTMYDVASISKLFTSIAVMQQVEAGRVDLDAPVATYLPAFAEHGKGTVTVRNLLTHTAGLPDWVPLYSRYDTPQERFAGVLAAKPVAPPGTQYLYSDLGFITLGLLVEKVTGQSLDQVVADDITGPLGMHDTMYNPPRSLRDRIAATEYEPHVGRGMVWGDVHDENAWSLGGVSGHAGVFSTAHDLAVLAQTLLNDGAYGNVRILRPDTVRSMLHNENTEFPEDSHGLGVELNQRWYMDAMSSPWTFGHTGFTGTSLVVDPHSDSFAVLLTNRVHPSRDWVESNNPARVAVARSLARAVPVTPATGTRAWFSRLGDDRSPTLTLPVRVNEPATAHVGFDLWYDTEAGADRLTFERSTDGGASWKPVPFTLHSGSGPRHTDGTVSGFGGRRWHRVSARVHVADPGEVQLRWRYDNDAEYQGRGVYVDAVRVLGPNGVAFDGSRRGAQRRFQADGWTPSAN